MLPRLNLVDWQKKQSFSEIHFPTPINSYKTLKNTYVWKTIVVLQVPSTFFKMQLLGLMLHLWRSQCDSYFLVISRFFAGKIFASLYRHPTHTISMTSNDSFYRSVSGFSLLKSNGSFALQSIFNLPIKNRVCWWVKLNPNLFQLPFPSDIWGPFSDTASQWAPTPPIENAFLISPNAEDTTARCS